MTQRETILINSVSKAIPKSLETGWKGGNVYKISITGLPGS